MKVIKRDGEIVQFDRSKIIIAIGKANEAVEPAERITDEQIEDRSMNLKCRLYRSKWVQSIAASDVMESGQVVENPMIGAIPSRNEVQRELDDLLMSM